MTLSTNVPPDYSDNVRKSLHYSNSPFWRYNQTKYQLKEISGEVILSAKGVEGGRSTDSDSPTEVYDRQCFLGTYTPPSKWGSSFKE
jgi:hypothetical protein